MECSEICTRQGYTQHYKLKALENTTEVKTDPRDFARTLAVIRNILLTDKPTQADINELFSLAHRAKGQPSPAWQAVGQSMVVCGGAIALGCGFTSIGLAGAVAALSNTLQSRVDQSAKKMRLEEGEAKGFKIFTQQLHYHFLYLPKLQYVLPKTTLELLMA